jgi:hypothetical protein
MADVGHNLKATVKGTILTLTIDLSKPAKESKSGKTLLVASSRGRQAFAVPDPLGQVKLNVNVDTVNPDFVPDEE